jgi:hypothetical protein
VAHHGELTELLLLILDGKVALLRLQVALSEKIAYWFLLVRWGLR